MARSRNIKPAFFKNESLGGLPVEARLTFIGLWGLADRRGRLEDRPPRIAAELFPYDRHISAGDVDCWLDALAKSTEQFIVRYTVGHSRFIQITNFAKHQSPHIREQASTIPAPGTTSAGTNPSAGVHQTNAGQAQDEHQPKQCAAPSDSLFSDCLNPDSRSPVPRAMPPVPPERTQQKKTAINSLRMDWPHGPRFIAAWERHHKHRGRTETQQIVLQTLMGRQIDWDELERGHVPYCEYWTRRGWSFCGMTFLEWVDNGMPGAPPEPVSQAGQSCEMVLCPGCNGRPCFCDEITPETVLYEEGTTAHRIRSA
jgi:hypothetical protein